MPEPEIRKILTVSASHLPAEFENRLREQAQIGRGLGRTATMWPFAGEYGIVLYAPSENETMEKAPSYFRELDVPGSVAAILLHARIKLDCSFVLFDADGDVLDGFATYEPVEDDDEPIDDETDRFLNHYRCPPEDSGCGHEWTDASPYTNNDRCPTCRAEIEPYKSEDL